MDKTKQAKAFTLIELLVVIAMMSIVSGIAFTTVKKGGGELAVDRAANKLIQDVRRTAQMALRGEPWTCSAGSVVGYGIAFSGSSRTCYFIYAECNDVSSYRGNTCADAGVGEDELVENIFLEQGVQIQAVWTTSPRGTGEVLFVPPKPIVYIGGSTAPSELTEITLSLPDGSSPKIIRVKQSGAVEILLPP